MRARRMGFPAHRTGTVLLIAANLLVGAGFGGAGFGGAGAAG
jgi:1,4-dihydroxy-2-naphthoate octaprenyltransferase